MVIKSIWGAPGCGKTYYLKNEFIKYKLGDGVLPSGGGMFFRIIRYLKMWRQKLPTFI